MHSRMFLGSLCSLVLVASTATGQEGVPKFPRSTANWINSSPITEQTLKGKAAVLYFFEET